MVVSSNITNPWPFLLPALMLSCLFFLLPTINMIFLSLTSESGLGFGNFLDFFATPHLTQALMRSLLVALFSTVIAGFVAWPLAYFYCFLC